MTTIHVDWKDLRNTSDFFDLILSQSGAPDWHGRSLDAIDDSWIEGSICELGPPFHFRLRNEARAPAELVDFARSVREIAEQSVREHGGTITD